MKRANSGGDPEERYILDLEYDKKVLQANLANIKLFYDAIIYGKDNGQQDFKRLYLDTNTLYIGENGNMVSTDNCLYQQLKKKLDEEHKKITEYSGIYYQEDLRLERTTCTTT